ncbi:DUF2608 domain-containing protein [archaeon]|nr:DUF2608 domain-containing protein [archaeon]NDB80936.1 DUF2608 domain-containing protein [archaeon]
MLRFNEFLTEGNKGLTIFDIDDTMFISKARVIVKNKNNTTEKALTPQEFNSYKLGKDEYFDYGEFRSSKIFYQTATPIARMVAKAKAIIKNATAKGSKVIVVTARSDMDDKDLFIKTFEAHGIPMKNVYVERAGNMSGKNSAANKSIIFRKYLKTDEYARVRLFDDHKENLDALLDLKREFPNVEMFAYLANQNGSVKRIK